VAGNARFSGFLGLAGTPIHNDDDVGYVVCFFDNEGHAFLNPNNEMRGYQATMHYTRTTPDEKDRTEGPPLGWDVFGHGGAVQLEDMNFQNVGFVNTSGTTVTWASGVDFSWASAGQHININGADHVIASDPSPPYTSLTLQTGAGTQNNVPYADVNIRGQMKPFQSELYFKSPVGKNYHVHEPAVNYRASLTRVEPSLTIQQWAGVAIDSPCPEWGSANAVKSGYGVWVQDLEEPTHTLAAANTAAIKLDGFNEYGRILWEGGPSVYCPSPGVLELKAGTAVQTASGVRFNVGGNDGNANCSAGSYSVGGTEVIDSNKIVHGEVAGNLIRRFSQETRPTLNAGEVAYWRRPSDGFVGLLVP